MKLEPELRRLVYRLVPLAQAFTVPRGSSLTDPSGTDDSLLCPVSAVPGKPLSKEGPLSWKLSGCLSSERGSTEAVGPQPPRSAFAASALQAMRAKEPQGAAAHPAKLDGRLLEGLSRESELSAQAKASTKLEHPARRVRDG